jgi:DNA polymerase-3 subunit beta
MEFKIPVEELQNVFARLGNVVRMNESGLTGMVLIEVDQNEVNFKCTDGSASLIVTSAQCEVVKPGKLLLRFRDVKGYIMKFVPLMEDYGTENFHFIATADEGLIKTKTMFQSGKPSYRKLKFEVFNPSIYPNIQVFEDAQLIVNSNILKRGIAKVLHCINPGEVRKAITGLNITVDDDKIIFVGTNGVKLAEYRMDIVADVRHASHILSYGLASVLRNLLDDDAQVFMKFDGRHVHVKSNEVYLIGSLIINESYPNYKPMFTLDKIIEVPRIDFADSVVSVMDVLDPEDNHRLTLNFNDSTLTLKNDRVEAVHEFGEPFGTDLDVDVNGEFLGSILRDFIGNDLEVHFTEGNNYVVFKVKDNPDHNALLTIVKRR